MSEKSKKILVLNYEFPPLGGGGGVAAKKLAEGFVDNGYEVDFLTSHFGDLPRSEKIGGINVYRAPIVGRTERSIANFISMLSYLITGFFKGLRLCWKNDYEFINTHFVFPTGPLGLALSRIFRVENVLSLHGGDIFDPSKKESPHKHWYYRLAGKALISFADVVIAQSRNTLENAQKFYKTGKNIKIIPLPYNVYSYKSSSRKELGLDEGKKYVIGVGRLVARKNFHAFVRAINELDDSACGLIIGEGPEKKSLEKLIRELKIEGRVKLLGFLSEEKKFQYLENADVYLLSSSHEGLGIVLQEAMQVGLPIVATNQGGQLDLIQDGQNGFLVDKGNFQEMAEAIMRIIKDKELGEKFSGANLQKILEFDRKKISLKYLEALEENKK